MCCWFKEFNNKRIGYVFNKKKKTILHINEKIIQNKEKRG